MSNTHATKHRDSKREQDRRAMLEVALARPGVREVMEVYRNWQEADSGLDAYRAATKEPLRTMTTDRANVR